jgi:excisionase family DNA binding protein
MTLTLAHWEYFKKFRLPSRLTALRNNHLSSTEQNENLRDSSSAHSLDALADDPKRMAELESGQRARIQLQCAALLAGLAQVPAAHDIDELLDPAQAAERLHVSRSKIYEMMRDGTLQYIEIGERGRLILESQIREFGKRHIKRAGRLTDEAVRARVRGER